MCIRDSPVLVLDDPFSALDRSTEDAIFAELQAYARDKVVFLISHRLYHFPQMQQIIFMEMCIRDSRSSMVSKLEMDRLDSASISSRRRPCISL